VRIRWGRIALPLQRGFVRSRFNARGLALCHSGCRRLLSTPSRKKSDPGPSSLPAPVEYGVASGCGRCLKNKLRLEICAAAETSASTASPRFSSPAQVAIAVAGRGWMVSNAHGPERPPHQHRQGMGRPGVAHWMTARVAMRPHTGQVAEARSWRYRRVRRSISATANSPGSRSAPRTPGQQPGVDLRSKREESGKPSRRPVPRRCPSPRPA